MAHLQSWIPPAALAVSVLLVSLLIAALMGFIIQSHKIKTRTLIAPLVVFIGIAIVLAVLTVAQQSSADTTTLATPTIPTEPRASDGPPGGRLTVDSWTIFGGIAKQVAPTGQPLVLILMIRSRIGTINGQGWSRLAYLDVVGKSPAGSTTCHTGLANLAA
jgi:hypothetical protein